MSSGMARSISYQDIQLVQTLIKRCLQLYMNPKEVAETLLNCFKIAPVFTELVWQKLEAEHQEFFDAYYLRLMVKNQITEFNRLLEQQVQMMHQIHQIEVTSKPTSNGFHVQPGPVVKQETMHHVVGATLPNGFSNGGLSLNSSMHTAVDLSTHASRIDMPSNLLANQTSNMMQGINGSMIKSEAGSSSNCSYMFSADRNILESRGTIGDVSIVPFTNLVSNMQPLNEPFLDLDASFEFLGQVPQDISLSDLTADFSQSSDMLESYVRSPFIATKTDNFLDSHERNHQDGLSYEDLASD